MKGGTVEAVLHKAELLAFEDIKGEIIGIYKGG
jgi:hypothetical protein